MRLQAKRQGEIMLHVPPTAATVIADADAAINE
jgi:hypothetical protein